MKQKALSYPCYFILLSSLAIVLLLADILTGSVALPLSQTWAALTGGEAPQYIREIIWNFRFPKACTAALSGMALSVCGLQMQTLFRNPLADPYVLGISSGAGLGVALFIMGFSTGSSGSLEVFKDMGMAGAGWIGALAVTFLIIAAAQKLRDTLSLLILGIMIGSVGSALTSLLQYIAPASSLKTYVLWTMGSFSGMTPSRLGILGVLCLAGLLLSVWNTKALNALLMGETFAQSVGVNIRKTRRLIFVSVAFMAGSVTAFCGPIGFIGIAVPHIARMLFNNADHKILLPATTLTGILVMLLADILSQNPWMQTALPINTVSALLGLPVIISIIVKNRYSHGRAY